MAAFLQPLEGATGLRRLDKGRGVHRVAECADGLFRIGLGQGINAAEHAVQAIAGAPAHGLAALLDSGAGLAVHRRQEEIISFISMISSSRVLRASRR